MTSVSITLEASNPIPTAPRLCPCGSGQFFEPCCQPIINGHPAPSAESLVRSRYTAFAMKCLDHVEASHAPEIRDDFNRAEAERLAEECEWLGLQITRVEKTENHAEIEYRVKIRHNGSIITKTIQSIFRRENEQWYYLRVKPNPIQEQARTVKVPRNEPCSCGSGKKFKKCCGTLGLNR